MSKSFTAAQKPKKQQPTPEEIAAFEQGGAGHDEKPTAKASVHAVETENKPEKTKRLSLDLPKSMHTRFKTACSATNRKMVTELQAFIEQRTAELEDEAGIPHK